MKIPLQQVEDVGWLREAVTKLYDILDDIDTADDIAKSDDKLYRCIVQRAQKRKSEVCESDGFNLFTREE